MTTTTKLIKHLRTPKERLLDGDLLDEAADLLEAQAKQIESNQLVISALHAVQRRLDEQIEALQLDLNIELACVAAKDAEIEALKADAASFALALVDVMDGVQNHDIQADTGLPQTDCDRIAKARAKAIAFLAARKGNV